MRRFCLFLSVVLCLILLCGCESYPNESRVQVSIVETDGCVIANNGIRIEPGQNAVFMLDLEYGYSLAGTDYAGIYRTATKGTRLELTLENIQYPTKIHLQLTNRYCSITYNPNGGSGSPQTVTYDTSIHLRPNTATGYDLFSRDGYILESWNTQPDGSGTRIGLGSRVSVQNNLTLYAQWKKWTEPSDFTYIAEDTVTITGYRGNAEALIIPEIIDGKYVTAIASGAFSDCSFTEVILPKTMDYVEIGAFRNCPVETVTLFDNIISVSDSSFSDCSQIKTLRINAIEAPYGYAYRKESIYADKVDLLIAAQGQRKMVFYGGCSMWYNLDGYQAHQLLGDDFAIINMGLNGTANSPVQMQIFSAFLEDGDILFHTPELSSKQQLLINQGMSKYDDKLWCGLEYNYDLFTLVDLRTVSGSFDSLCLYLDSKIKQTNYRQTYQDDSGQYYCDEYGCLPVYRTQTQEELSDKVYLDPDYIDPAAMARLNTYYDHFREKGVTVFVSYACVNMDAVPEDQRQNVELMDSLFKSSISAVVISDLDDYLFRNEDFFDTNYHMLSTSAVTNTELWLRDLAAQLEKDGLWRAP